MDKEMSLKNRDRLIQLGITISTFRKYRGLSQEQLAERASVSRSLISSIEAAGIAKSFSLEVFYESGFACVVSTVSGETDCGFDAAEEGGTYTLGAGEAALRISTTSGNVELAPLA